MTGGDRLVVTGQEAKRPDLQGLLSLADFRELHAQNRTFAALEAATHEPGVLGEPGNPPERLLLGVVSPGLFAMIQTPPILGRGFVPADGLAGAPPVILLGHDLGQRRYAGASDILGRVVRLNGAPATLIGVLPAGFKFPDNQDLWTVLTPTAAREDRNQRSLQLFGLLKPGTSLTEAQGDLTVIASRLAQEFPDTNLERGVRVQTFHDLFNGGPIRVVFLLMLGAVGFVLLIACANAANLTLSRTLARRREFAVRTALGASRGQLLRQLLLEAVLLSGLGGLVGLALSSLGVQVFDRATQTVRPFWIAFTMDWRAFGYFAVLSILSGLVFGLVPAPRASRLDLNTALKEGSPTGSVRQGRLTALLVVFQFALTVMLLASAGLMIRSFLAVQRINTFIPATQLLTARVNLPDGPGERYASEPVRRRMHEKLQARLSSLPGVTRAALTSDFPGLGAQTRNLELEGRPATIPAPPPRASPIFATPSYLPAIGLPLLADRGFLDTDGAAGREAAVVTRAFAARHWPGASPLGQRFRFLSGSQPGPWIAVVGVCGDLVQNVMDREAAPVVYLSHRQEPWAWLGLILRTDGDAAALAASLRSAVQELDQDLPLFDVGTLADAFERQHWFLRVFGTLFFAFALVALLMASVGLYAVVAQSTMQRTREIGIRLALGATGGRVVRLVLSRGLLQLGLGLALGLVGAWGATRLMRALLVVSPTDPLVFALVPALLAVLGLLACWLPARRAARIAPTKALRTE